MDFILEHAQNPQTKVLALSILQNVIQYRWKILPASQKDGIKTFVVNFIIKLSADAQTLQQQSMLVTKLNIVLVQILKQDWPQKWPNFIPELVHSSKSSQTLCANNMAILLLLSEEVFDFSAGQMTQQKMKEMKETLNKEFTLIFQLCDYVLQNSQDSNLLSVTLQTLLRFLHWIPVGYIFETNLIQTLACKFFPVAVFQNDTLRCLSEIGSLSLSDHADYNAKFVSLFVAVIDQVDKLLTPDTDIARVFASGENNVVTFVRHLAIFVTGFLKAHLNLLESGDDNVRNALYTSLTILLRISKVDDTVIFKICLEYWSTLITDLYNTKRSQGAGSNGPLMLGTMHKHSQSPRVQMYSEILSRLRLVFISKMAKPEEVLICENEHGEIVRESMKDTDSILLYKNMREVLIYLTHLDTLDTQKIMIDKLSKQVDRSEWSWDNLNTLCWAIGSISGALSEIQEKSFLVGVIKDLLGLCERTRGKDHKAVIASNIMYVVGQYPRFLRQHWRFLQTVVNKLFEFMHEKHPGVQDMSVDTFLKIAKKCRRKFVDTQADETNPFIETILRKLPGTIKDLETGQIHTFYEAVAEIIQSQADPERRQTLIFSLMELPNTSWAEITTQAKHNTDILWDLKNVKAVALVLKTNNRVAKALGHGYVVQLSRIFMEMLQVYKLYSGYVSSKIAQEGPEVTRTVVIRTMRSVKKETLKLILNFVQSCTNHPDKMQFLTQFLPELIDPILEDYKRNVPAARDAEVLSLFAAIVTKLGGLGQHFSGHFLRIFDSVFQCTLDMITKNFEDFPDHRLQFFKLLRAINLHCFPLLLGLNASQFQLVMDSIIWAMKHLERNITDTGLSILLELLRNIHQSDVANDFYKTYFISLLQELLNVLTDTFHKSGFRMQATLLAELFHIVETGAITVPLWGNDASFPNNQTYVRHFTANLMLESFETLNKSDVENFMNGLFQTNTKLAAFKQHLRDFLISLKEFSDENDDLYLEEKQKEMNEQMAKEQARVNAVPGLLYTGPSANNNSNGMIDDAKNNSM